MRKAIKHLESRWRRLARRTQITLLVLVALVLVARMALPYAVKYYVNRQLNNIPDYRGSVVDIDIQLIRGAYKIRGLKLEKTTGKVPVPFIDIPVMDLSVQWGELFHGSAVGEVVADRPQVNFVNAPSEAESQTGAEGKTLKETLESLFPFQINRFKVVNGDIRFRDFHRSPKVDIYMTNLSAMATNLTNSREVKEELPAGLLARGKTIGRGEFTLELKMNPLEEDPTFKMTTTVTNMDLVALNDFLRAYGKFDVESGEFQCYVEIAAADGRYEGYIKPFFKDLDIFDWDKERGKNILEKFWQAIVAGVAGVLKNQPRDQLATTVPLAGDFEQTDLGLWAAVGGILKNAFVRALVPAVDRTVEIGDLKATSDREGSGKSGDDKSKKPEGKESEKAEEKESKTSEEKEPLKSPKASSLPP